MTCSPFVILCAASYSTLRSPPRTGRYSVPWVVRRSQCNAPAVSKCVTVEVAVFSSDPRSSGMLRMVVVLTQDLTYFATEAFNHAVPSVTAIILYKGNTRKDHHHHQHQQRYGFHSLDCHLSWSMLWLLVAFLELQWAFCSGRRIQLMLLFDAAVTFQRIVCCEYRGFNICNGVCLSCGT